MTPPTARRRSRTLRGPRGRAGVAGPAPAPTGRGPPRSLAAVLAAALLLAPPGAKTQPAGNDGPAAYQLLSGRRFEVRTDTDGLLGRFVHHHVVRAGAFSGTVRFDPARPSRSRVRITVPVDSLVVDSRADPDDRASIRRTMTSEVLRAAEHPTISFRSTRVRLAPGDSLRIRGELTLAGATRPVTVTLAYRAELGRLWAWGSFTVRQTDFGIEPYAAGAGTLKVADPVTFHVDAVAERRPGDPGG